MQLTTMKLLGLIAVLGMGIFCVTHFLMRPSQRPIVVGWICLVFSLCVFVAPLCILVSWSTNLENKFKYLVLELY